MSDVTACEGCDRETRTIGGRCPNCGYAKTDLGLPRRGRGSSDSFWDAFDDLLGSPYGLGLVLLVAALLVWLLVFALL